MSPHNGQRIEGTNTFFFIKHFQVRKYKLKDITYAHVFCTIRPTKENIYCTRITIRGNCISYNGNIGTSLAYLETAKLLLKSVLSRSNTKFKTLDIANFYLMIMEKFEYMRIKIEDIPQEIIDEYHLQNLVHNRWVHIEIRKGAYSLPQSGILAYTKLSKVLNAAGYHEAVTTPGL